MAFFAGGLAFLTAGFAFVGGVGTAFFTAGAVLFATGFFGVAPPAGASRTRT